MGESSRRIVAGKYELLEMVGQGGMASVWRASVTDEPGVIVAVKKIKPQYKRSKSYQSMFIEEARVGGLVDHANIVQVVDFCIDENDDHYLIMEWMDGVDLGSFCDSYIKSKKKTPWRLVVAICAKAMRGLAAAHERVVDGASSPIIHRDVSPHNILVDSTGAVKLTDFGLARAQDRVYSLTKPGTVKGKASFLAPEQTRGEAATEQTDIFSAGIVLWESLAGKRLFDKPSVLEILQQIRKGDVASLTAARKKLPTDLVNVVNKALAYKAENRFQSAAELADALDAVLEADGKPVTDEDIGDHAMIARKRLAARRR